MKKYIRFLFLSMAILTVLSLLFACSKDNSGVITETSEAARETTPVYSGNYSIGILKGYDREKLQISRPLTEWLGECDDTGKDSGDNYIICSKRSESSGILYEYFIYRPGCAGKKLDITYDVSVTESTYYVSINYVDSENDSDCVISSVKFEIPDDRDVSLSVSDNGTKVTGFKTADAGDTVLLNLE